MTRLLETVRPPAPAATGHPAPPAPGPHGPHGLPDTSVELRPASRQDLAIVRTLLAGLTAASSFARFFTGLATPPEAMVRALVDPAPGRGAWLATVGGCTSECISAVTTDEGAPEPSGAPRPSPAPASSAPGRAGNRVDHRAVGHASWARTGDCGEISVVVADDWQGRGLGRALVGAVLAELRTTSAVGLRLDVLASNRLVIAMIGRRWPGARPERDGTQLTYWVQLD